MLDAEMLLFIDDQKSKIFELYTVTQKRVCPTHDVYMPAFKVVLDQLGILAGHQTRQLLYPHRKPVKALLEGQVMLTA